VTYKRIGEGASQGLVYLAFPHLRCRLSAGEIPHINAEEVGERLDTIGRWHNNTPPTQQA